MAEAFVRSGDAARPSCPLRPERSVVTAAAVIMTGVFAAPLLRPRPVTRSIGLLRAGRRVLAAHDVPAGRWRCWAPGLELPRRLERLVPGVDIEAERLAQELSASPSPS
jgi:hypothetical protein